MIDADVGALHDVTGHVWLGPPKIEAAGRRIDLPHFLAALLQEVMNSYDHDAGRSPQEGSGPDTMAGVRALLRSRRAAVTARARKLERARDDLQRLERGLESRHYPTVEAVNARIAIISRGRRVGAYLGTEKGPLAVAVLFLKNNRRIAALVTVICLALLIFCLVERQVRQALAEQGQTKVQGLYAGRPAIPTARLIFQALATIKIIPETGQSPPMIPQPTPLQLRLLDLLHIDPRQLR